MILGSLLFLLAGSASALRLPVQRRVAGLQPRSTTAVLTNPDNVSNTGFTDAGNGLYTATLYIQGEPFQVQIDSGSTDLWVNSESVDLQGLTDTGVHSITPYGDGTVAEGPIVLANVTLGEFTVSGQALVTAPGSNATTPGEDLGLLGVGLPLGSSIYHDLNGTSFNGLPFLQNVFYEIADESKFITLLLSRTELGEASYTQGGALTIGELVSNYSDIVDTPRLPVVNQKGWYTWMDGITVNGVFYPGNGSSVAKYASEFTVQPGANQSFVLLDSGTSLAQVPRYYLDAMFQDLPGAIYTEQDGKNYYTVPCETKVNISMIFGNNSYPVHPLDSVFVDVNTTGAVTCRTGILNIDDSPRWILGDTFMRNVYTLFYHGNGFLPGAADESTAPYMQILSLTDADEAFAEYDEMNARRIAENEYEVFADLFNLTSSTVLAASATYTYSLVNVSAATATPAPADIFLSTSTLSTSALSTSTTSAGVMAAVAKAPGSASVTSGTSVSLAEWTELNSNIYIIIGLLSGALALGVVCFVLAIKPCSSRGYSRIQGVPPATFKEPESTPLTAAYHDHKH
ncbi:aspartic peptidase domain-containing protein [Fomitopsis serialis]|uniref:aspartic peptidase domain-containing protein n=1 Tax=Fomitopsis serialis TaxID=139415 RepID=UPI00200735A9|nr:aspartic peptidase domain-containing protein [Neoantrodia serialis]KAH9930032.1 aspartic peptidase domain-containing protein [Neoantrodia serialis]